MKKHVTNIGWTQKMIRITSDYDKLCFFIDFWAKKNGKDVVTIYDEIFNYSLDNLFEHGFHYRLSDCYSKKVRREPKGFLISNTTRERFENDIKQYASLFNAKFPRNLTVAEFTELLIYIYCMDNFSQKDKDFIEIDWRIVDTKSKEE